MNQKNRMRRSAALLLIFSLLLPLLCFTGVAQETDSPVEKGMELPVEPPKEEPSDSGEEEQTVQERIMTPLISDLMAQGFPRSYAERLAELQLEHPNWTFEPLFVGDTWEYALLMEVEDHPARNLISKGSAYVAYRHETNETLYDTGWYQASRAAVSYFMDPRNFLNETDVFQFYQFTNENVRQTDMIAEIEAVLAGTFMQDAVLENGLTYAQTFLAVGEDLGISPLYLAVKARQEQGLDGSLTSSGRAGELLTSWLAAGEAGSDGYEESTLAALDGYYNIFNISASGTGRFRVLLGAMNRAVKGTPEMEEAWGSPAWDTIWKSIYGGALTIKARYADNDQNSLYLQKFNVSPDAKRRYWGQYMQNVMGALSEGRSLFHAFDATGALDGACTFRIPIYEQMSESACADPAQGQCASTMPAIDTVQWQADITLGRSSAQTEDEPLFLAADVFACERVAFYGQVTASGQIEALSITPVMKNGELVAGLEEWTCSQKEMTNGCFSGALIVPEDAVAGDELVYRLRFTLESTDHGKCRNLPVAYLVVRVQPQPSTSVEVWDGEELLNREPMAAGETYCLPQTLACGTHEYFLGWLVEGTEADGLYPSSASLTVGEEPVRILAVRVELLTLSGAALRCVEGDVRLHFEGALSCDVWHELQAYSAVTPVMLFAEGAESPADCPEVEMCEAKTLRKSRSETYLIFGGDTPLIEESARRQSYAAVSALRVQYIDGSAVLVVSDMFDARYHSRTAATVAQVALADTMTTYPVKMRDLLARYAAK